MINGTQIIGDPAMPERREVHRQERKWARRVKHDRGRRFDVETAPFMINFGGIIIAHPNTIRLIERGVQS